MKTESSDNGYSTKHSTGIRDIFWQIGCVYTRNLQLDMHRATRQASNSLISYARVVDPASIAGVTRSVVRIRQKL